MNGFDGSEKKLNAGRARSMDLITTALFELLEKTPFAQITISELCKKAGVARKTFYRNFNDKTAVVE
ncbi:MAG: TetR/AcrR family transcriptional regulator, partial [Clostridiales bacterium]|nr:TetR/AcrR family transcriptional regulator [Clostridiales bacterium]